MNKNKFYVYALLCLSLISYPCIASDSEKEEAAQALISLSNPSPQSEKQPPILLSPPQLGTSETILPESTATVPFFTTALSDSMEQSFEEEKDNDDATMPLAKISKKHANALSTCQQIGCKLTPAFSSQELLTEHIKTQHTDVKRICTYCGKSFAQLGGLTVHKQIHTNDASEPSKKIVTIEAPESESEFTVAASGGTSAVNNEPYKIKDLFCKFKTCECKNEFESSELLKEHIQKQHSQFKNVCEICGKSCAQLGDLAKHTRTHTGEKPYKCTIEECGKAFAQLGDLAKHTRTHTGDKPYKCTIDKCDWAFNDQGNLKKHINSIHKGDKSYRCTSCNKSFAKKQVLQRHQASKTGCRLQLKRTHGYASEVKPSASVALHQTDSLSNEYSSESSEAEEDTETEE